MSLFGFQGFSGVFRGFQGFSGVFRGFQGVSIWPNIINIAYFCG
jgi:hypothetical protein